MTQPPGYLSNPRSGRGRGVLVLHAWWGLNGTIRDFCTRLSGEGFTAFAPDLYHGEVATTIPEAKKLRSALDRKKARAEMADALEYLAGISDDEGAGLALIGFSLGAYFAMELATAHPEHIRSVVTFYGSKSGDYSASKASFLAHFAEKDPYESESGVKALEKALRAANRPFTFYHYPATGHWFFEPDRADAYNREAAELAWQRTLAFLKRP